MSGPRVILVGPPGAGKTTVGRLLAERLGVAFHDTDAAVEAEAGKTVADLFVEDGEPRFRELELAAAMAALENQTGVVSLGGGAVGEPRTRRALAGRPVVFLDVSPDQAFHRVGLDRSRPLLAVNPRAELRRLLEERRPLYLEVASATVDTGESTPEDVVDQVLKAIG